MAVHNIISFINALGYFVLIVAVVSSIILKSKQTILQTDIS